MLLISGMCMTSICIFYAVVVKREFKWFENVPELTVSGDFLKYEYGGCVYAGFILSLLCYILVYFWIQAYFAKKDSNMSMDYSGNVYLHKVHTPCTSILAIKWSLVTKSLAYFNRNIF